MSARTMSNGTEGSEKNSGHRLRKIEHAFCCIVIQVHNIESIINSIVSACCASVMMPSGSVILSSDCPRMV